MHVLRCLVLCGALAIVPAALHARASDPQDRSSPAAKAGGSDVRQRSELAGLWTYNADESVNAATGRPEQAPRSATSRKPPSNGRVFDPGLDPGAINPDGGSGRGGERGHNGGNGYGGGGGAYGDGGVSNGGMSSDSDGTSSSYVPIEETPDEAPVGPTMEMIRESRDLSRDLLEVPEALTIRIDPAHVTFVDDLDRTLTYPTDGSKQHYHLAASSYDAQVEWDGAQLKQHIQGAFGFKMTETYFLSPDGQRLFVVIRVGDPKKKDGPVVGVNRVYDRRAALSADRAAPPPPTVR